VDAAIKAVRAGFASRSDVVAEQGEDAAEIDAQQAEDAARADALGLKYDSDARRGASGGGGSSAPAVQDPEDGDAAAPAPAPALVQFRGSK